MGTGGWSIQERLHVPLGTGRVWLPELLQRILKGRIPQCMCPAELIKTTLLLTAVLESILVRPPDPVRLSERVGQPGRR